MRYIKIYAPSFILLVFFLIPFYPIMGEVDRQFSGWVYLSIFNVLSLIYLGFQKESRIWFFIKKNMSLKLYLGFFLWGLFTTIFSINIIESLVILSKIIQPIIFIIIGFSLINTDEKKMLNHLLIIGFVMIFLENLTLVLQVFNNPNLSRITGATGNQNIAVASLNLKLPLLLFFLFSSKFKNIWFKIISIILFFCSAYFIVRIGSKAGILELLLILIFQFIFLLKSQGKKIKPIFYGFCIGIIFFTLNYSKPIISSIKSTIEYQNERGSLDRLRYYSQALNHMIENPIFGTGIGSWKIESLKYDAKFMNNYIVQYHTHNDILQFGAETGIVGLLLFLSIFLTLFFKIIKSIRFSKGGIGVNFALLLMLIVYFIDLNLNFPFTRPIMHLNLALIFLIANTLNEK